MLIEITQDTIDVQAALDYVRSPACGAVTLFEGNIRNTNDGEQVTRLEYEVYDALLHNVVAAMWQEARARWQLHELAVIQRRGMLQVGDTGIVICVSSAHRREALDALSYMIEEFKKRAPVWKREHTTNHQKWINWTPQLSRNKG